MSCAIVLYEQDARSAQRVKACSAAAWEHAVRPGMPLAEAQTLLEPGAAPIQKTEVRPCFARHDVGRDREALVELAEWCEQFSPLVGLDPGDEPDTLLLEVGGLAHLFGGEAALSFPVELVRSEAGEWPPGLADLGLDRLIGPPAQRPRFRSPWLWLEPVAIRLQPADVAVRLSAELSLPGPWRMAATVLEAGKPSVATELPLTRADDGVTGDRSVADRADAPVGGVFGYDWKSETASGSWSAEGFCYVEPLSPLLQALPTDPKAWRDQVCRARQLRAQARLQLLDAPLLFVKQHPYFAGHIYDDFYTWHPGGGIYVLENPAASTADRRIRAIIDAGTNATLGPGVYRDPDLSWDAQHLLFAFFFND